MAALAGIEELDAVEFKVVNAKDDSERLQIVIDDGAKIGYGNVVKLLKGWTATEVKAGRLIGH